MVMRDWNKLDAFHMADDDLALAVLTATKEIPMHQRYVLVNQIERAALSIPSNIVEGCARHSEAEYPRFLDTVSVFGRSTALIPVEPTI
jgi:hypothetical protein